MSKGAGRPALPEDEVKKSRNLRMATPDWEYLKNLAEIRKMAGVGELIESMLPLYEAQHVEDVERTKKLLEFKGLEVPARLKGDVGA